MALAPSRNEVLGNTELRGLAFSAAMSRRVDTWLQDLWDRQIGELGDGLGLIATGGYGRGELSPHSDLDVVLVHDGRDDIADVANRLWYPIWDEGVKLGHAVRTPKEALALARTDLETATSLLTLRHIAGDEDLVAKLADGAKAQWRKHGRGRLLELHESVRERHRRHDEVAFMLEPDLKDGRGGLRDVHALGWAQATERGPNIIRSDLHQAYEVILAARVELHRATGRPSNQLLLEEQDAVAAALDYDDADVMMADIAAAARRIAWRSDEAWDQLILGSQRQRPWRRDSAVDLGHGISSTNGRIALRPDADITPLTILRLARAAAEHEASIDKESLDRLDDTQLIVPDPWPEPLRTAFVDLLRCGHAAIPVIETLDQLDLFVPFLPEWEPSRSRPQRNRYHRFTVDRHLLEAAAEAAKLADTVDRPDLLVMGALLHDIGKPYPGDHTEVGMKLVATIGARMGFAPADVDTLVDMVKHHLLLPDVATRRDINDDDTLHAVANEVGDVRTLELLARLTVADSIATGPAAWSTWKAGLVTDLVNRTTHVLEGGDAGELSRNFPTAEQRLMLRRGTRKIVAEGDTLTVITVDRPGIISRTAGALALHGLDVLEAAVHTEYGMSMAVYRVEPDRAETIDWDRIAPAVEAAVKGRLALEARLLERIETYQKNAATTAPLRIVEPRVLFDNELSSSATVIEIGARDGIGLLYRITRCLGTFDLSILRAKVQTLGDDVVDSFYVRDLDGRKVEDPQFLAEVEKGLMHAIRSVGPLR